MATHHHTRLFAFISLLAVTTATCSGCGGGGGGSASNAAPTNTAPAAAIQPATAQPATSSPTNTAAPMQKKTFVLMIRGDSTNYGSHPGDTCDGAPNQTCANPTALMQADFDLLFGAGVVTVINRAEPGSTLANDLDGTGPYTAGTLAQELATSNADVVLTNSELNDATYGVPVSTYVGELETWIATVQRAGKTPVLMEPNPTCLGMANAALRPLDASYVAEMDQVGQDLAIPVLPVYDAFVALPQWQSYLQADCEHPTDAGYEFKEGQYMKALYPIVKSLLPLN